MTQLIDSKFSAISNIWSRIIFGEYWKSRCIGWLAPKGVKVFTPNA